MKVIQVLPQIKAGGVERGVLDLVCFFKSAKNYPDFESLVVSAGGKLAYLLAESNIKHYQLRVDKKSLLSLAVIPQFKKIILNEKPDIIHARSRVPAWIAFFASRNKDCQFLTTAHGIYKSKFFSEVMGWGKFVICPSKVVAKHMKNNYGVPEEKIKIVPRWVDLNKFKYVSPQMRLKSNTIISVGRISPSKGYEFLIDAFRKVVRHNPYLKLKIIGSVDRSKEKYFNYLKTLVSRFSLSYNVDFLGYSREVEKDMAEAKILVAPSVISEAFGRVVIEAAACGVPVIATRVGAYEEIIENGNDGILVPPSSPKHLADAIVKLIEAPGLAEDLAQRAREKVEKLYSMEESLVKIEKIYRQSLKELRILVIKISSLGDLILIIPSLIQLRKSFPQAKIYLLTSKKYASLFYSCPYVDEVIGVFSDYKKIKRIFQVSKQLRRISFDFTVDFQNNRASQLLSFLSFPRKSFGFKRKFGFLLSSGAPYRKKERVSPLDSQEKILELLGVKLLEKKLKFWDIPNIKFFGLQGKGENFIGLNVSASLRWQTKNWPIENINQFLNLFFKHYPGYKLVLTGDGESCQRAGQIGGAFKSKVINLCGKTTLPELILVLKKLKVFISSDSACLHIAQSLQVPVIGLFGPTDPFLHTVSSNRLHIIKKNLSCSPCYSPTCKSHNCMKGLSAKEIFLKIQLLIKD